jgi:hypothetical protein
MNQQKMSGDYVVTGLVTGTHIIEDIGVPVPHQIAVRIPVELALRSRDLQIGLQQKRLFLLKGGSGLSVVTPTNGHMPAVPPTAPKSTPPSNAPSEETQRLRQDLATARQENAELRAALKAQDEKLGAILEAIGKLSQGTIAVEGVQAAVEAVGGEAPMFIPSDGLKSTDAETNIKVAEETVTGASVADAASKLRGLRKKAAPD